MPINDILENIRDSFYNALEDISDSDSFIHQLTKAGDLDEDNDEVKTLLNDIEGVCYLLRKNGFIN